jgi:hypothetical protein
MVGTVTGAVFIVVPPASFPQSRISFLVGLAAWGAACGLVATIADPTKYALLGAADLLKQTKNVWIQERNDDFVPRRRKISEVTNAKINNTP